MTKQEVSVYLDDETLDVVEALRDASLQTPEIWDMSRSEAARELVEHGIENLGENPDLEELIDDVALEVYRKQKKQDRLQKKGRVVEMTGGWRGRVRSRFNARLAGSEPYPPEKMEELRELYWGEIENWEDDDEKLPEHETWLDDLMTSYKDAYAAKQVVPDVAFENVDDVDVGADLLQLREQFDDVLLDLADVADGDAYDVDAIYRKLAGDYAVDEDTIELVVDELTGDRIDPRRALKSGDGIADVVDADALRSWGGDVDALEAGAADDQEGDGDTSQVAPDELTNTTEIESDEPDVEVVDDDPDADAVDVVDADATVNDGAPGTQPLDVDASTLAPDTLIDRAVELIENGGKKPDVERQIKRQADSNAEAMFALTAARERLAADDVEPDIPDNAVTATDGGESHD